MRDVANIPITVALVTTDLRAFNHLKRIDGERRVGEEAFCIAATCEAQPIFRRVCKRGAV